MDPGDEKPEPANKRARHHADGAPCPGVGVESAAPVSVTVAPTTGGQFELKVALHETIDSLKKIISKRLKVPKERICLLSKDRYVTTTTNQTKPCSDQVPSKEESPQLLSRPPV